MTGRARGPAESSDGASCRACSLARAVEAMSDGRRQSCRQRLPGSGSESSDGRLLVDGRTSEGGGVVCPPWQAVTPRLLGALTMTDVTEASHSVSLSLTVAAVSGCGPVASCACCCWWCE